MNGEVITKPILLWGMMGTGKSTVVRRLGSRIDLPTLDLDECIEKRFDMTIGGLVRSRGLAWFRDTERALLLEIINSGNACVVSLGGGALLDPELRGIIRKRAFVCCLSARIEVLCDRLVDCADERPLLSASAEENRSILRTLSKERQEHYFDVDCMIDTSDLAPDEVVDVLLPLFFMKRAA